MTAIPSLSSEFTTTAAAEPAAAPQTTLDDGSAATPDDVSAREAAQTAAVTDPSLMQTPAAGTLADPTDPANTMTVQPRLETAADGSLVAQGALSDTTINSDPSDGVEIGNGDSTLTVTPTTVAGSATNGVKRADAVVFANTAQAADTIIKPTALGASIFTQIRDSSASESYSWTIDLANGEQLRLLSDGGIAVIQPMQAAAEQAAAQDRADSAAAPQDPGDPSNPTPAQDAAQAAATVKQAAAGIPAPSDDEVLPPSPTQAADKGAEITGSVQAQLHAADKEIRVAQAEVGTGYSIIAAVAPPWAKDAGGRAVPVSFTVDGDTLTMVVHHLGDSYIYPIEADPWFFVGWGWFYVGEGDGNDCIAWYDYTYGYGFGVTCPEWFDGDWTADVSSPYDSITMNDAAGESSTMALRASADREIGGLNDEEAAYCFSLSHQPAHIAKCEFARTVANEATTRAYQDFSHYSVAHKGRGAAFRHCFWVGVLDWHLGTDDSLGFGYRHVHGSGENRWYVNMGLNNNWWGAALAPDLQPSKGGGSEEQHARDHFSGLCHRQARIADVEHHPDPTPHPTDLSRYPGDPFGLVTIHDF